MTDVFVHTQPFRKFIFHHRVIPKLQEPGTGTLTGATDVYFDAHYGWRPVIVYAQGRKVTVGIYKDASCIQLVNMSNPTENWLQLSSYPNYTEVVRNGGASMLTNQMETNHFVPTRFQIILVCRRVYH